MPTLIAQATSSIPAMQCLFGYYQGLCAYNYHSAPVYFSLGDAVAAIGLIFAVYQLRKRSWEVALRIRPKWQRYMYATSAILGVLTIALGTLVTEIPIQYVNVPFNHPLLFEFVGFMFFIAAPVSLYILATEKRRLFTRRRAGAFYQVLLSEVAQGKSEGIEIVVNIIGANLEQICLTLNKYGQSIQSKDEDGDYGGYADAIFTVILSEQRVADYICTARLDFLFHLFGLLKKYSLGRYGNLGIERIFETLFRNKKSHLYKQLDYKGMSISANLYDVIFSDISIVDELNPFRGMFDYIHDIRQFEGMYLDVVFHSLERAIKAYWKANCPYSAIQPISNAFHDLNEYFTSIVFATGKRREDALNIMSSIAHFLGHTYVRAYKKALEKGQVNEYEKACTNTDFYSRSLNAYYAESVYEFMEKLVMVKDTDDRIRLIAMTAVMETVGVTVQNNDGLDTIRKEIIRRIWEKINGTGFMSNADGYFPVVFRIYLSVIGLKVNEGSTPHNDERKRLIEFMNTVLKSKVKNNEKMRDEKTTVEEAFLPKQVTFNRKTDQFEYHMNPSGVQVLV